MTNEKNWMDLPTELLYLISRKLPPDYLYFILFRTVCKTWRSSAPLSDPPPTLPFLLECSRKFLRGTRSIEELRFYSFATGKTSLMIHLQAPFCRKKQTDIRNYYQIRNEHGFVKVNVGHPHSISLKTFPLVPYLIKDLQQVCNDTPDASYNWPVIFDSMPTNKILLISTPMILESSLVTNYFVESCGEILRVIKFQDDREDPLCYFHIYKFKLEQERGGNPCWVKVNDIGDQILFLDEMNGFSMKVPAGFKGNCVYFLSYFRHYAAWRFDLTTGIMENVPCPFPTCGWFFPSLI